MDTSQPFNAGEYYRKGRRAGRQLIAAKGVTAAQQVLRDLARHEPDLPRAWKHELWGFRSIVTEQLEEGVAR